MATTCPICEGTGWKPQESAGVRRMVLCDCQAEQRTARRLTSIGIPSRYEHCDFENFETNIYEKPEEHFNHSLQQAKLTLQRYAADYPAHVDYGLLLMGPCGVGKTHLGVAALLALAAKGHDCLFYDFRELLKEIQNSYNPISQTTETQVLEPVLRVEVLLLDDLGAIKPSAWVQDIVGHILNSRYNEKRATLMTTNFLDRPEQTPLATGDQQAQSGGQSPGRWSLGTGHSMEDSLAERIGERVRSRLYEMCRVVEITAPDYRQRVRQAQYR